MREEQLEESMLDRSTDLYREDLKMIAHNLINCPKGSSVLVIGATGLIGSMMVDALLYYNEQMQAELEIYGMCRNISVMEKIFPENEHLHFIEHDIKKPLAGTEEFQYIFMTASFTDPSKYAQFPVETMTTNLLGVINVLEYAREHKSKVLFTSTMETYGQIEFEKDITEEQFGAINFHRIRSGYPESKRTAELLCASYLAQYQVESVIVRLGYIYGPTMTPWDSKVVAQLLRSALAEQNLVLKSKGTQRRSYCYVADAVAGIFKALFDGEAGEVYNVADKNSIVTISQLAEAIGEHSGCSLIYDIPDTIDVDKPLEFVLNTTKLENLGWESKVPLKEGIDRTLKMLAK